MTSLAGRRVAVIGGTGFIGSHLTQRLVGEGADVLAVARSVARVSHLSSVRADCTIAVADVRDRETMTRLLRRFRPEIVFHMAAHPDGTETLAHLADQMQTNGVGLVNTLQAAVSAGTEVFVYGASAKDFGNSSVPYRATQPASPISSYSIMKVAGWQLCQLVASFAPIKAVALRPTMVYGPRQNYNVITYVHQCVTVGQPVRLMGGTQTRDPLFIDDAVRAFVAAATERRAWGQVIPVGGGQELTVASLCETVVAALGASVSVIAGAEEPRLTEIWRSSSDNVDAYRLLGWEPRVTLAEGLKRTAADLVCGGSAITTSANPQKRPDCYRYPAAPGVVYRMLDRRDGGDRRSAARGGRRAEDVLEMAVAAPSHAAAAGFRVHTPFQGDQA